MKGSYKQKYRIRKRVICLGLGLGLAVSQLIIFKANKALAVDIMKNPSEITLQENIDPLEIINKVNQNETQRTQLRQNSSSDLKNINNIQSNNKQMTAPIPINKSNITQMQNYSQNQFQQNTPPPVNYGNVTANYQTNAGGYDASRPEWIEFCPFGLENAQKDDSFHFWGTNSRYKAEDQNYWVERRKDFEKHLAYCDKVTQIAARNACYQKLRKRQQRISASYVDPWKKAEIRQERWMRYAAIDAIKNPNINIRHSGTVNQNINYSGRMYHNVNWFSW